MNKKEKVIIQSNPVKASVAAKIILVIGGIAALVVLSVFLAGGWEGTSWLFALGAFAVFGLIALVVYLAFNGMQITVTDKRVYGRGFFGKRMSLPCDQISSVGTTILFGGVIIGTSSGYLRWYCLGRDKMAYYDAINDIFINRQGSACNNITNIGRKNNASDKKSTHTDEIISKHTTEIENNKFFNRKDLTSVVIPNGVTSIGKSAFQNCSNLTRIVIPNSMTSIGDSAFAGCSSLKGIVIPNSVTHIGYHAFVHCDNLTIYCKATKKPSDWTNSWNSSNRPVVWGCTTHDLHVEEQFSSFTPSSEIPSFDKNPKEFVQKIKDLSTEDLKTILDDQQDLYDDEEIEIIQTEYNKRLKETNLFDLL